MFSDSAPCQCIGRRISWAVVWRGDGVLHIVYQESDGDGQSAGISGKYGGSIFRRVSVPAFRQVDTGLLWGSVWHRHTGRNALLSGGHTGYGEGSGHFCLCNPIPYEHHVRHGHCRVPDWRAVPCHFCYYRSGRY